MPDLIKKRIQIFDCNIIGFNKFLKIKEIFKNLVDSFNEIELNMNNGINKDIDMIFFIV